MVGHDNSAFVDIEDDKHGTQETAKKPPADFDPMSDIDPFSKALVTVRSSAYNLLTRNPKLYSAGIVIAVHAASIAYFTGALVYHYQRYDSSQLDFCNNVGLLIIIDAIVYGTLLYYFIKQYCWEAIWENALGPFTDGIQSLWAKYGIHAAWFHKCVWVVFCALPAIALGLFLGFDVDEGDEKRFISLLGVAVLMLFGFIFSKYPGHIKWRPVYCGFILQYIFGFLTVRWETGRNIMSCLGDKVTTLQSYTNNGTNFVYGEPLLTQFNIFAFSTLSVIFFFSFIINILSYYGALQWFIKQLAWVIQIVMGTTVCESVNAAACIFLGMTEAPLLYQTYIPDLTKSELHAVMCGGWSTIAGTVMAAYIAFGVDPAHLIAATLMSAPASLCYAKLFYPETEVSKNTVENITLEKEEASNVLDAACKGAISATELVLGIIANIIAFLAFVSFLDGVITWLGTQVGVEELSFQFILSKVFIPVSYLMGVDNESLEDVAVLVGTKTVINEFQAYQAMTEMVKAGKLSARTEAITTYALCGFSNFSSIGILIGSLSTLSPSQRPNITEVALRGFIAANIVCFLTACIAGTLITQDSLTSSGNSTFLL